ncbi:MAG: hypothetical protein SGI92_31695 [Bryobacteraceae bacterium]|nr:hypothetical protein [Bryobacteraceae bacterium]
MSRYLALLETHLSQPLLAALNQLVDEANAADRSLYVAGATMRDLVAGMQAQELELVIEGEPGGLAAKVPRHLPVRLSQTTAEQHSKPGGRPKLVPASIHDYLRSRDFSVNAIALSVTRASRGLLLDPANGTADIAARELRALTGHTFKAHPDRMLEMLRLKVRLGFSTYPRTQAQFDEAVEAGWHRKIKHPELRAELQRVAAEPRAFEVLQAWDEAGLLSELLPSVAGESLNTHAFAKVQKIRQLLPYGIEFKVDESALFFNVLTDGMSAKDRAAFLASAGMESEDGAEWMKLARRVSKTEKDLASSSVQRPSHVYGVLTKAGPTVTLLLALRSGQRVVQDRIRNYLTKYLPTAMEVQAGESVARRLDARPKRPVTPVAEAEDESVPGRAEA